MTPAAPHLHRLPSRERKLAMLAVAAVVIFLLGFLLHLTHNDTYLTDCLFLGLAFLAAHFAWTWRSG